MKTTRSQITSRLSCIFTSCGGSIVVQCAAGLPENKPRYLMGVGYPLDLVVCTALGVDM
jgi:queuine/archaeosine tRNA-ribosyltransferase